MGNRNTLLYSKVKIGCRESKQFHLNMGVWYNQRILNPVLKVLPYRFQYNHKLGQIHWFLTTFLFIYIHFSVSKYLFFLIVFSYFFLLHFCLLPTTASYIMKFHIQSWVVRAGIANPSEHSHIGITFV